MVLLWFGEGTTAYNFIVTKRTVKQLSEREIRKRDINT
jgi:hypothetical protein